MAAPDLQSIAFPTLDEFQIAELSRCTGATPKMYPDGTTLFPLGTVTSNSMLSSQVRSKSLTIPARYRSPDCPSSRRVHRRYLSSHRQSLRGQCCC